VEPRFRDADLNAEVIFDRYIGAADDLDLVQAMLLEAAPRWSSVLRVWNSPRDQRPIDAAEPGALRTAVMAAAGARGPTYRALVERYGAGDERLVGSVELRGGSSELVVIVSVDERVVSRLGDSTALGNKVALQVGRAKVAGRSGTAWTAEVFEALCRCLSPVWGQAGHPDEYWAKVVSERPSIRAVGRDFGRFLPGVFWLNFFGRRYRDLFGDDRLQSTPASQVVTVEEGVLIGLGLEPSCWDTPEYAAVEQLVRDHLGPGSLLLQGGAASAHGRTGLESLALPRVLAPARIAPRRPPAALDPRRIPGLGLPAAGQAGPMLDRAIRVPSRTDARGSSRSATVTRAW
jgi:hypothetical protein